VSSCFGDIKLEEKQEHEQDDDEVETPCASNCLGHRKLEEEEEEEEDDDDDDVETPCVSNCLGDGKLEEDDDDVMKTPSVSSTFRR
jgi:hypothetical protein